MIYDGRCGYRLPYVRSVRTAIENDREDLRRPLRFRRQLRFPRFAAAGDAEDTRDSRCVDTERAPDESIPRSVSISAPRERREPE